MSPAAFEHRYRVTYADCTSGNHVYYGRYLEFLELARGEFFRSLGKTFLEWQNEGFIFPVIECRLRYRAEARYDDLLTIGMRVELATGARLTFTYEVLNQAGRQILEGETMHACTSLEGKPRRLPPALQALKPARPS